ncbi:MAG: hypothetical protein RLZZ08_1719 [Pseudomonadota bacterium]
MQVAVLGAGGKAGSEITKELVARGHGVIAIGRTAENLPTGEGITVRAGDVSDADALAGLVKGADAVISAIHFNVPASTLISGLKQAGVNRLIITGGAASLNNADGVMLYDAPGFPEAIKPFVKPAIDFLNDIRQEQDLNWTFFSPAMTYFVGPRTGQFRLGKDVLVSDANGESKISYADSAIVLVDELEQENNPRGRFTAAY